MIIKLFRPRAGLKPRSARKAALYLGIGTVIAIDKVGEVKSQKACLWRRHPALAYVGKCREVKVDIPNALDEAEGAVEALAEELDKEAPNLPRGVTLSIEAALGPSELGIDIDIYSDEEVPRALGTTAEPAAVIAEPRGYIGEEPVDSFYQLAASEEAAYCLRQLARELYRQAAATHLKAATYAGVRQYALSDLVAWVKASRNYALDLPNAIPLWYNPWPRQIAKDLYALAPEEYRRLAGAPGLRKALKEARAAVKEYLKKSYEVDVRKSRMGELMLLYPRRASPPAKAHEAAVEALREALGRAFRYASGEAVRKALERKRYLTWADYVAALGDALRQELTRRS